MRENRKQTPHHQQQHWQCPGSALCTHLGSAGLPRLRTSSECVLTCPLPFEGVPHVAVEVVVAGEQQAPALGEGHGGDAADDVVVGVHHQLLVCPQVKQPARGVVRARGKRVAVGEKLQRDTGVGTRNVHWACVSQNIHWAGSVRTYTGHMSVQAKSHRIILPDGGRMLYFK